MTLKDNEQICFACNGAGTMPTRGIDWEVRLCRTCDGHGVLAVIKEKVIRYDATPEMVRKIATK
jgi:DnaJ-class molecular chaperone